MNLKETEKLCPECGKIITFITKYKAITSIKNNSLCRSCRFKGDKNPMFGKPSAFKDKKHTKESLDKISKNHINVSGDKNPMFGKPSAFKDKKHTKESLDKIGKVHKGKLVSEETKKKISQSNLKYYETHSSQKIGKKCSEESKVKMRLSAINRISECKFNGNQFYPTYNKNSILIIEEYALNNNLKIKHAENGGEFFIKELGYWVDGYDIENNIVIEFNEKYHKYTKEKDKQRRNNIINFLKCKFVIIDEDLKVTIINNSMKKING